MLLNGRIWTFYHVGDSILTTSSYLIVRGQLLVVPNRRQPVADLDSGRHAICNPRLAERDVQTEKFERDHFSLT